MILMIIIGLLALFSLLSFALGTDEPRQAHTEPGDDHVRFLMRFGAR